MFNRGMKSTGSESSPKNKESRYANKVSIDGMSIRSGIWGQQRIKDSHQRPESCNNCHTRQKVINLRPANQEEIKIPHRYDITNLKAKCDEILKSDIFSDKQDSSYSQHANFQRNNALTTYA